MKKRRANSIRKYKNINDRKRAWQLGNSWYLEGLYKERKRRLDLIKLTNGCAICGFNAFPEALEFHHVNPSLKKFRLGSANLMRSWSSLVKEIRKCVVLCSTCHKGVTVGRLESPKQDVKLEYSLEAIGKYNYERKERQKKKEDIRQLKLSKFAFELDFNPDSVNSLKSDNLEE